jgi:hypothetical protein
VIVCSVSDSYSYKISFYRLLKKSYDVKSVAVIKRRVSYTYCMRNLPAIQKTKISPSFSIYIHTYIHTYIHAHACTHTQTHTHARKHTCMHTHTLTQIHTQRIQNQSKRL